MESPQVYRAITAIAAELSGAGIAKRHRNERDDYRYRSIDDVLNRLSPLLAKHRLCPFNSGSQRNCARSTAKSASTEDFVTLPAGILTPETVITQ